MNFDYDEWKADDINYSDPSLRWDEREYVDIDHCRDFLQSAVDAVYKTGDVEKLEGALDELCGQLKIRMPATEAKIEKKVDGFTKNLFAYGVLLSKKQA